MSADATEDRGEGPLDRATIDWIREVTGAADVRAERRSAGASRAGYAVDATMADGTMRALWYRVDTGFGPQSHTTYTVRREATVYAALRDSEVRVPPLLAVHPTDEAFLSERVEGRNWFAEITSPAQQGAVATEYMAQLAALHRIDPSTLALPDFPSVRDVGTHVLEELDLWDAQHRAQHEPDPLVVLARTWLRGNVPPNEDWPVVLVHGDAGPGNFMYDGDHVTAVMDWEMAHYGDLHDDLGWLCVRALQEPFTHLPDRLRDYERFAGRKIDDDRLRWFRLLAQARCAIGTLAGLRAHDSRGEIANHLIYSTLHVRLLAEALADVLDVPIQAAPLPDSRTTDETWMFDVALDDLRDVIVPAVDDHFASRRAKGLARLLKYLREHDRLGAAAAQAEAADLRDLLGQPVDNLRAARAALCEAIESHSVDERAVLRACLRDVARRTQIARPAMGSLADRHYAPLR